METNVQVVQEVVQSGSVQQKRRKREKGFTLIEMLAVVLILAIVAGAGFVAVNKQIESSREKTDVANFRILADASAKFLMDHPNTGTGQLTFDTAAGTGLLPEYLAQPVNDPWDSTTGAADYTVTVDAGNRTVTISGTHTYTQLPKNNIGLTLTTGNNVQLVLNY